MKRTSIVLLPLLLSGCMVPRYQRPEHPMPARFHTPCKSSMTQPLRNWWYQFHDETLNKLITQAINANYDLAIAIETIEQFRAQYQFKKSQLLPQIDVIGAARHTRFSKALAQTSFLQNPNVSFFQLGTDSFWEFDFWGKLRHERTAQLYTLEAQIEQMRNVYISLIADVARAYVDLCAIKQKYCLQEKKIFIETQLLALLKDRFSAGISNEIAVLKQQQLLGAALTDLEQLKIEYTQTKNSLALLLGRNPEDFTLSIGRTAVPLSHYQLATGIPSDILRRRPDIREAERRLAAAHELVGAAVAEWFPRFTLFGGLSSESSSGKKWFSGESLTWYIGPSIRWPLINFGRINATINVQESLKRQAALRYSQTIIAALKDVEDFLAAYCYSKEELLITRKRYEQAVAQEQLTADQLQAGLANKLQLLEAQRNRIETSLILTQIRQAVSDSLIGIYKALGGGW